MSYNRMELSPNRNPYSSFLKKNNQNQPFARIQQTSIYSSRNQIPKPTHDEYRNSMNQIRNSQSQLTKIVFQKQNEIEGQQTAKQSQKFYIDDQQLKNLQNIFKNKSNNDLQSVRQSAQQILRSSFQKGNEFSPTKSVGNQQFTNKNINSKKQISSNEYKRISLSEQVDFEITPQSIKSHKRSTSKEIQSSGNILHLDDKQPTSRISRNPSEQSQLIKKGRYIQELTKQLQKATKKYQTLQLQCNSIKQNKIYFEQYSTNLQGQLSKANDEIRLKRTRIQELLQQIDQRNRTIQQLQKNNSQLNIKVQFCMRYHGMQENNPKNNQQYSYSQQNQNQTYNTNNIQIREPSTIQMNEHSDHKMEELNKKLQDYQHQLQKRNQLIEQLNEAQKQLREQIAEYHKQGRKSGWISRNNYINMSNTHNLHSLKQSIINSQNILPIVRQSQTENFIKAQYQFMLRKLEDKLEVELSHQSIQNINKSNQDISINKNQVNRSDKKIQLLQTNIQQLKAIIQKLQNQGNQNINTQQNEVSPSRKFVQTDTNIIELKNMLQQQRNKHKLIQQEKQRLEIEVGIAQQNTNQWMNKFKQLQHLYSVIKSQQQKKSNSQQNRYTSTYSIRDIQNKATSSTQIRHEKLEEQTEFQKKQIYYLENLLQNTEKELQAYKNQVVAEKQIKQKLTQKILEELALQRKERQAMMEEYQKINMQLVQLSESYKQVNNNHQDLTNQLLGREKSRKNLIDKLQQASSEVNALKKILGDRDNQYLSLVQTVKNYQNQVTQLNQKLHNNVSQINKYEEQSNILRQQYKQLINSKKPEIEGIDSYVDKRTSSKKSYGSISERQQNTNTQYINQIKSLQQNNNTLETQLKIYKNKINQLQQKLTEISRGSNTVSRQTQQNTAFSQFSLKHTRQLQNLTQKVNYLSDELSNAKNTTIPNLQKQIKQKQYKYWYLQEEVKKSKAQLTDMNQQLNDKQNKIFMLSNKMTQAQQNTANNFAWLSTHKKNQIQEEKKVLEELWNTKMEMKNVMMDQLRMEKYQFQNQNQALKEEKLMMIQQKQKIIQRVQLYQDLYAKALQDGNVTAQNFEQYKGKLSKIFTSNKPTKEGRQKLADQLGEILKMNLVHFLLPPKSEKSIGSRINALDYESNVHVNIDSKTSLDGPDQQKPIVKLKQRQTIIDDLPSNKETNINKQISRKDAKIPQSNQQLSNAQSKPIISSSISSQNQYITTFGPTRLENQTWRQISSGLNRINSEGSLHKFVGESIHGSQATGQFQHKQHTQGVTFQDIRSNIRKSEQMDHEVFRKTPHTIIYNLENEKKNNSAKKSNASLQRKQKIQIHITKQQRESMSGTKQNKMHEIRSSLSPEGAGKYYGKEGQFNPFYQSGIKANKPSGLVQQNRPSVITNQAMRPSSPINIKNSIIRRPEQNIDNQNAISKSSANSIISFNFNKARGSKQNDIQLIKSDKNLQSDSDSSGIFVLQKQKQNGCCFDD